MGSFLGRLAYTNGEENWTMRIAMIVEALDTRGLDYPVSPSYVLGPVDASEIDKEKLSRTKDDPWPCVCRNQASVRRAIHKGGTCVAFSLPYSAILRG